MRIVGARNREGAYTVLELLVTAGLVGVLLAMTIRPLTQVILGGQSVRKSSMAVSQNLFFLETLARDARSRNRVVTAELTKAAFVDSVGMDTITWKIEDRVAWREAGEARTPIPIAADGVIFAWASSTAEGRYFCVRGDFAGLGGLEQGIGLRLDP